MQKALLSIRCSFRALWNLIDGYRIFVESEALELDLQQSYCYECLVAGHGFLVF